MPLKVSDVQVDSIPDPDVDEDDPYHWLCSLCGKQLEVDWRGVETRPVVHTLDICLKFAFEIIGRAIKLT